MIIAAVAVVVVVAAAGLIWSRFSVARAERRSLNTYERALGTLGDVAKRSDASADVHTPAPDELARPHVRPPGSHEAPKPIPSAIRIVPPPRIRLEPLASAPAEAAAAPPAGASGEDAAAGNEAPKRPSARNRSRARATATTSGATADKDADDQTAATPKAAALPTVVSPVVPEAVVAFDFDDTAGPDAVLLGGGRSRRIVLPSEHNNTRRAATGVAAAVVVGVIAVGGWHLASHKNDGATHSASLPPTTTPTRSTTLPPRQSSSTTTTTTTTTVPTPTTLQPTSTSARLVTYIAPARSYTVTFKATTGECWLGAQSQVNTTAYLKMWTLTPGESASYTASGPLVVKIGAPKAISVDVNGRPLTLPAGNIDAYDISFVAASGTPA